MSRRFPSNLAEPIQFLGHADQLVHALPQAAGRAGDTDPVGAELALRNVMRAACGGDPRAQFDLGVEAMRRIVGEQR